jgi:hypothetical protein
MCNVGDMPDRLLRAEPAIECVLSHKETPTRGDGAPLDHYLPPEQHRPALGRKTFRWDPDKEQVVGDDEAAKLLSGPYRAPWTLS